MLSRYLISSAAFATINGQEVDEQSFIDFSTDLQNVFAKYELTEELIEGRKIAKGEIDVLEEGSVDEKADALAELIDPLSSKLMNLDGEGFVDTMSEEAIEFYSDATVYWALNGNFTAYQSVNWGTKRPPKSNPQDAIKCAAQKGKC